jgi:metal-sulfur cluster biosynthetic enzyme
MGADDRTVRMVNFLADSAIDMQLLTFHAFRRDGQLFLAKQIETTAPVCRDTGGKTTRVTKETNLAFFTAKAEELKVTELVDKVKQFFRDRLPAYEWPGKYSYSFSLMEKSERGNPTYRVYVSVGLHDGKPGKLTVTFTQNACQVAQETLNEFQAAHPKVAKMNEKYQQLEVAVTESSWEALSEVIDPMIPTIMTSWKAKQAEEPEETGS